MWQWLKRRNMLPRGESAPAPTSTAPQRRRQAGAEQLLFDYLEERYAQTVVLTFEQIEDLLEAGNLLLGLREMILQRRRQVAIGRLLDHFWERLLNLLFGVLNVLDDMKKKAVHGGDVFCKEAHGAHSRKLFAALASSVLSMLTTRSAKPPYGDHLRRPELESRPARH